MYVCMYMAHALQTTIRESFNRAAGTVKCKCRGPHVELAVAAMNPRETTAPNTTTAIFMLPAVGLPAGPGVGPDSSIVLCLGEFQPPASTRLFLPRRYGTSDKA